MNAPKIAYCDIADPRLGPDMHQKILERGRELSDALKKSGVEVVLADKVISDEREGAVFAERARSSGCCGVIIRLAWFHRANVPVGIAQHSGLPCLLCALSNPNDTGFEGLALAHGALDEVGIPHQIRFGDIDKDNLGKIADWIKACYAKRCFWGATYGEIGGRCLEMLPGSSDYNQLRKIFGFHVDPMEQWTLIHEAEKVPETQWRPVVKDWRKRFKSVKANDESMNRSARLYLAGKKIFAERNWDFAGIQCQLEMIDNYLAPCLPVAMWNEDGFTVSCETDMNNALGMFMIQKMTGKPGMFSDIFHFDREKHQIHALNCGTAAPYLAGGAEKVNIVEQTPYQGTWDEKKQCSLCKGGACNQFIMQPGPVTIIRFGRIDGKYVLHVVEGEAVKHKFDPNELRGITAVWPFAYVQLPESLDAEQFISSLRSHHAVIARCDIATAAREFAKLMNIPLL